jgi:RHS repeat-associated protein
MGFGYDANGRVVKATRAITPDAHTVYDALGNRVATKINDVWQYMIYDAFGKLVAEYGVPSEGMGGVKYIQQDHQGSVRTVTNSNGFVLSRTDHQAFGETIGSGVGLRSVNQGYGVDPSTRQAYGLTENDDASGQQHTWFRKLETHAGRWSSPDPYKQSMNVGDPQSFNRYAYVGNEPTNYVDPSGLMMQICIVVEGVPGCLSIGGSIPYYGAQNGYETANFLAGGFFGGSPPSGVLTITRWLFPERAPTYSFSFTPDFGGYFGGGVRARGEKGSQDGCTGLALGARADGNAVVITFSDGSEETRRGGTRSWRNNNPGNLRSARTQIGRAGGFAVFGTIVDGEAAKFALLTSERYQRQGQTVGTAIATWAPPSENNTARYQAFVANQTGLSLQTAMNSLSPSQLVSMANAMRTYEGYRAGTTSCSR